MQTKEILTKSEPRTLADESISNTPFPCSDSETVSVLGSDLVSFDIDSNREHESDTPSELRSSPPPPYEDLRIMNSMPERSSRPQFGRQSSISSGGQHHRERIEGDEDHERSSGITKTPELPNSDSCRAVLVMGATGAGKSSFIAAATGLAVKVGHSLDPCTVDPKGWTYTANDGSIATLIDTPGFSDQKRPDTELLESIVKYIRQQKFKILGVIYIHRITERKLSGSTMMNLRMLRAVCGEHYYQNLLLVTSMWNTIPASEKDSTVEREVQFNTSTAFWADMLDKGATYSRWDDTSIIDGSKTAKQIVQLCTIRSDAPEINIMLEIDKGANIEDTAAHRILTEEFLKCIERRRHDLLEEEEERRYLQRKKAELEATVSREQASVRREMLVLQRVERNNRGPFSTSPGYVRGQGLINSLATLTLPLRRRVTEDSHLEGRRSDRTASTLESLRLMDEERREERRQEQREREEEREWDREMNSNVAYGYGPRDRSGSSGRRYGRRRIRKHQGSRTTGEVVEARPRR